MHPIESFFSPSKYHPSARETRPLILLSLVSFTAAAATVMTAIKTTRGVFTYSEQGVWGKAGDVQRVLNPAIRDF